MKGSPKPNKAAGRKLRRPATWLDSVDDETKSLCVQRLLEAARGTSLALSSLGEGPDIEDLNNILWGLASVLRRAADEVDAAYFHSAGAIAQTLPRDILTVLLKRELERVEHQRRFKRELGRP